MPICDCLVLFLGKGVVRLSLIAILHMLGMSARMALKIDYVS